MMANGTQPEPFAGFDDIDEAALLAQLQKILGVHSHTYIDGLRQALKDIQAGALPDTALAARTGLCLRVWRDNFPTLAALIDQISAEARILPERALRSDKPDVWLRAADPAHWTPREKREHDLTKFSTETLLEALAKAPGEPKQ